MAELFLEIFSEEIPARMQAKARADLERLVCAALKDAGLAYEKAVTYTTPRRLVLKLDGVPLATPDVREERRGPRADAPEKAIEGFLRGAGLSRDDLVEREDKKGAFLYAVIEKKGGEAADVIAGFMPDIIRNFPWPKSQRWGAGALKWVRPLHSIACVLDGKIVKFEIGGIKSDHFTHGHRFMSPEPIEIKGLADYSKKLKQSHVMIDHDERADSIRLRCKDLAKSNGLEWVEDEGLLTEVAGLVEWPVALMGSFDKTFMRVPEEVLILTMKKDQKYFVLRNPQTGKLAPHFITVSNIDAKDGGDFVRAGNERVLSARLSDAKFFWDQDLKGKLEDNVAKLSDIVFHDKLGTVAERVERIKALSGYLAKEMGCDVKQAERASELSKADLVSNMVGEFADLQGVMGRYYALEAGEPTDVADAIRDHYAPKGPDDECPSAPVSVAVALAEKIDTLVGFFGADMKPTGSKDPFALRRAALGVIRLITENELRLNLTQMLKYFAEQYPFEIGSYLLEVLDFIGMRLIQSLRDSGVEHYYLYAALQPEEGETDLGWMISKSDDLTLLVKKIRSIESFATTDDGLNLIKGYKRAANILKIEEKKDKASYAVDVKAKLLSEPEEKALNIALDSARSSAAKALKAEDFEGAMSALSKLRAPTDAFFDKVTVNDENATVRANRLALLSSIRSSIDMVADFSQIEG